MPVAVLRIVLALAGFAVVTVGVNVGLGGIATLGWQVSPDYVTIADPAGFATQDSHVRFLGGLFAAIGATLIAGAVMPQRLWPLVCGLCALMPVAGFFRLSDGGASLSNSDLYLSLAFEFALFPILSIALWRVYGRRDQGGAHQ